MKTLFFTIPKLDLQSVMPNGWQKPCRRLRAAFQNSEEN